VDDVRGLGDVAGPELAGVLLDRDHPEIFAEPPIELFGVDVDGHRPASRRAGAGSRRKPPSTPDVEGHEAADVDAEPVEGLFELEPAAADEGERARDLERGFGVDELAGLRDGPAAPVTSPAMIRA